MNNSVIKDNYSTSKGGALYIEDNGSPQILNTLIVNNNSESSTIRVQSRATPIFENVVVSNNGNSGFSCNNEWNSTKVHLENVTIGKK